MRRYFVLFLAMLCVCGCRARRQDVTSISTVDDSWGLSIMSAADRDFMSRILGEVIAKTYHEEGKYRPEDFRLLSGHRIPPQPHFPKGATILRAEATESEVFEYQRMDLTATIFIIPGRPPTYSDDIIPSKGRSDERYSIYDVGRDNEVLLITETGTSAIGGSILIGFWNTETNHVRDLWGCAGEEGGFGFSHSLWARDGTLRLTVFGIFQKKRDAYEKDRPKLAAKLGFPVDFVYDSTRN